MSEVTSHKPTAAIVIIGAEVLSGKIPDKNGPYLIQELRKRGIDLREIRTIGDDIETISQCARELAASHDYLFTTGGIGGLSRILPVETKRGISTSLILGTT